MLWDHDMWGTYMLLTSGPGHVGSSMGSSPYLWVIHVGPSLVMTQVM